VEEGEVGENVRHDGLRMIEPHHHRRIVRIVHERHVGEVVHARVPRRRVAGGGERPGDVARGRRNAVVPTHAGPQPERDHPLIGRPRPGARQIGLGRERRLVRLVPGDPVERLLGPTATSAQLAAQRRALGLDRPLATQYAIWVGRFARGDWGRSIATGRPVRTVLGEAVPATLALVGASLVLSYLLGLAVGAWQSGAGPRVDTALSITTVTLFALPGYWLGLMLVMAFTYWAHWLPAFGAAGLDADGLTGWSRLADRLRHFALPLATLTLIGVGGAARFVRGAMRDVMSQPFVRTAEAKGLTAFQVTRRHVARN